MDKKELSQLYEKYLRGDCTLQEEKLLEDFLAASQQNEKAESDYSSNQMDIIGSKIYSNLQSKMVQQPVEQKPFYNIYKIAAVVTLFILAAWVFYSKLKEEPVQPKEIAYITKSTLKGQKLDLVLSDGTSIKLNSESEVLFPETFSKDRRIIYLKGEAFFDVARDENRPFIIHTDNLQTTVLGTSFNINAYPENKDIEVSVITGKVKVESEETPDTNTFLLTADEMVSFDKSSKELKKGLFNTDLVAWRKGVLIFSGEPFNKIVEKLERWYGVEFQVKKKVILEKEFFGRYNNENLNNILETLSYASKFNYKIENKQVTIY
ncbi:FecR family protein [Chondrinema litorale]|uniref:FecR family protein n=1 Tax=Chondrinema litorale TaxID=2994555 RepID=UPI002542D0FC|nr:FecR family protein [Chondrinema litorale]UZR96659.1 FecR domain-containing protein [Chondrinema litorale]